MNTCPVDGLPSEILVTIFVTLNECSHYARSIGDESYGTIDYPVTISSVCSRWRYIAINTPYLWSYIDFATAGNALQKLGRVNRYFGRAQNVPLHFRFGTDEHGCLPAGVDENVATLLRSGSSHLKSLAISYYYSNFAQEAISALFTEEQAPPITSLALRAHSGDKRMIAIPEILSPQNLNQLFLNLDSLYLDSVSPEWDTFPCRNLVELQLIELPYNGFPNIYQLVNLLRGNPFLRSIKLSRFYLGPASEVPEFDAIPLPQLQNLDLDLNPAFISSALDLIASGSYDLSVRISTWSGPDLTNVIDSLICFSKRSRITSLHLSRDGISFPQVCHHLPHLRTLRLSFQMLLESMFAGLPETAVLLPHLHTIEILSCANGGGVQKGLRNMCKIPSLRRIRFRHFAIFSDGRRMSSEETVEWFIEECADNEMEVMDSPDLEFSHLSLIFYLANVS